MHYHPAQNMAVKSELTIGIVSFVTFREIQSFL